YRGFPGPVCISINDEIVHGIPGSRSINDGDLVKIDVGVEVRGYFADAARTFLIGNDGLALRLVDATRKSLDIGIKAIRIGGHVSDISSAIESYIKKRGFSVVRDLTGHGIGSALHEDPPVPNFGKPGFGPELEAGMVLAIEPMVNAGSWETIVDQNGWTILTKDRSLSAHFEDTVAVTRSGVRNLTRRC
ncbi:MAG TPA: type I methionyl aminopeptidase, partial [bacterium (Candidatus Stahlbacteria)]|nr:type I methionyl aminopeptidase [Candidatus Stahlbacteria bacterium]